MEIGDRVKWTKISKRGSSISMSQKEGSIKSIEGENAMVRPDNSARSVRVSLSQLRPITEKGFVTQFVEAVVENNRAKARPNKQNAVDA
jgi:hypothetical protein